LAARVLFSDELGRVFVAVGLEILGTVEVARGI
jgi:hypothetical protein